MNRKSVRNAAALLMAFAFVAAALAGCGTTQAPSAAPPSSATPATTAPDAQGSTAVPALEPGWKGDTSPITFDWYCNYSWQIAGDAWQKTKVAQYVTSKTGVSLNIIAPAGNETEKLNTMIASNSLPDFVTSDSTDPLMKKAVDGGQILPLNDLADQYDPFFYTVIDKDVFAWYKQDDGKTYGYVNWAYGPETLTRYPNQIEGTTAFLVRKDMYEAIGSPDMRTPEGFLNALQAAKEKYPEVNGQPLIPLGFSEFGDSGCWSLWQGTFFTSLLSEYLAQPKAVDGKITDRLTDPEFVMWLKTIRKANEMGLVAKEVFIAKDAQIRENVAQGRYFAMIYRRSDMLAENTTLFKGDLKTSYIAIDPPANSKKDPCKIAVGGFSGWCITMISKNCKNPERAIEYMTYRLSDEGQRDTYLGKQGETWDVIDGKEQFLPDVYSLMVSDKTTFDNTIGGQYGAYPLLNFILSKKWEAPQVEPNKQPFDWTLDKVVCEPEFNDLNPVPSSDEGVIDTKISNKWGEALPKLLLAKTDAEFDTLFSQFLADRSELGFEKLMAYWQAKYESNKAKLGMK
jgi:putative aldouronate transport system substrate-binding protein